MKKFLKITLALLCLLALLCGCVPKDKTDDGGTIGDDGVIVIPDKNGSDADNNTDSDDAEIDAEFGMPVIKINLNEVSVDENGVYSSRDEVAVYIYLFHKLPQNFVLKANLNRSEHTAENKLSAGGNIFYNREGLLPKANGRTYTECDIDYTGGSRGAKRIVFSSDWLIFYTSDHYESFSIIRIYEN